MASKFCFTAFPLPVPKNSVNDNAVGIGDGSCIICNQSGIYFQPRSLSVNPGFCSTVYWIVSCLSRCLERRIQKWKAIFLSKINGVFQ